MYTYMYTYIYIYISNIISHIFFPTYIYMKSIKAHSISFFASGIFDEIPRDLWSEAKPVPISSEFQKFC